MKLTRAVAILLFSAISFAATAAELLIFDTGLPFGLTATTADPAPAGHTVGLEGPGGAVGGIGGPIAFATLGPFSSVTLHITIADCCLGGDVYELILDGLSRGLTPPEPIAPDGTLSVGDFYITVAGGAHSLDVWDMILSYIGFASPFGGGVVPDIYSPAGLGVRVAQVVPEPSSMLLLGVGLVALGMFARRKLS